MEPYHQRLIRIGLNATADFGFVLAGGYAVQVHGILVRPSEDVDLFTNRPSPDEFAKAVDSAIAAYETHGLVVEIQLRYETFARLFVTDTAGFASKVELGYDWRALEPTFTELGPVLHPDDAVANKVTAAWGRYLPRDFIDVDAALTNGGYTKARLLEIAAERDGGFTPKGFAFALGKAETWGADLYARYGLTSERTQALKLRLRAWREEIMRS
jgi:hypothetical protein